MLRRMLVEDIQWAAPLAEATFAAVDRGYGDALAAWVADPACAAWVAEAEGRPVGFAVVGGMGINGRVHVLEVLAIAVEAASRRTGVGRHLLAAVLQDARRRGARRVWSNVAASNVAALAMFRQAGFRVERADDGAFANGETAVRLTWARTEARS